MGNHPDKTGKTEGAKDVSKIVETCREIKAEREELEKRRQQKANEEEARRQQDEKRRQEAEAQRKKKEDEHKAREKRRDDEHERERQRRPPMSEEERRRRKEFDRPWRLEQPQEAREGEERHCVRFSEAPKIEGVWVALMKFLNKEVGPVRGTRTLWEESTSSARANTVVVFVTFWWPEDVDKAMVKARANGGGVILPYYSADGQPRSKFLPAKKITAARETFPPVPYPNGIAQVVDVFTVRSSDPVWGVLTETRQIWSQEEAL